MFKQSAIFGAILLGLAVPSAAQQDERGDRRAPTRAQRDLREPVRQSPITRYAVPGTNRSELRGGHDGDRKRRGRDRDRDRRHGSDRHDRHDDGGHRTPRLVLGRDVHHHYVTQKVWVPGATRRVWVPDRYESRWDPHCGHYVQVLVHAGHYTTVQDPGHWEYRRVKVPHRSGRRFGIHFRF